MTWTTPADLKRQVQRLWDRGLLLSSIVSGDSPFPRRLNLKSPNSKELSERFPDAQDWIRQLSDSSGLYRIEWRSINHRTLGLNKVPAAVWIDRLSDALRLIGKEREADRFAALAEQTKERHPELMSWLRKHPMRVLELDKEWIRLLEIVGWMNQNPRPAIYLRQIDLPGVHTKLIEKHRGILAELFDLVLPEDAINKTYTGINGFCRRYGFAEKPLRIRFRVLDPNIRLFPGSFDQDITVTLTGFTSLNIPISKVFITENEINFLAFPKMPDAIVVFGGGYGVGNLTSVSWLHKREVYYWGDIDTHGFAILDQLRGAFPHVVSFLMDRSTFLAHRDLWGFEPQPETKDLERLTPDEGILYDELRWNYWGKRIRLEQERIRFNFLRDVLGEIAGDHSVDKGKEKDPGIDKRNIVLD